MTIRSMRRGLAVFMARHIDEAPLSRQAALREECGERPISAARPDASLEAPIVESMEKIMIGGVYEA
jgi:hypothetical protein